MRDAGRRGGEESCILVTGASRGIGHAIARTVGGLYDTAVLVARCERRLAEAADALEEVCSTVHAVGVDITDAAAAEKIVRFIEENCGRLDALVHAAGAFDDGLLQDGCDLMSVNYHAPARLTVGLLPMLKRAKGQIVFINSTQGLQAGPNAGAYAASKFALHAFADSLRAEINTEGVRVLSMFVGATATDIQERIHAQTDRPYQPDRLMQPADIAAMVASALQLPRSSEVVEMTLRPMQPPAGRTQPCT